MLNTTKQKPPRGGLKGYETEHKENYCLALVTVTNGWTNQNYPIYAEGDWNKLIRDLIEDDMQIINAEPSISLMAVIPERIGNILNAAFMFDDASEDADHKKRFEKIVDECDALATILDWHDPCHGSKNAARVEDVEALARLENLLNYIPDLKTLVSVVDESNPDMWFKTVDKRFEDWDEPLDENCGVEWDDNHVSYRLYWA